jgi:hypothetical protein
VLDELGVGTSEMLTEAPQGNAVAAAAPEEKQGTKVC